MTSLKMMSGIVAALLMAVGGNGLLATRAERWEHGWKTPRVIATRYSNEAMGFNIGFKFPKNLYNADRSEVFEFIEKQDAWVYQGGGYPGAEMFVVFRKVKTREQADKFLPEFLPKLDKFMGDLQ